MRNESDHGVLPPGGEGLPGATRLGPYRLIQQLGEGGMGVVHLALDRTGRAVAIKVLRPHIAHDPDARARLAREVATLERVQDPGVAPVLDADTDGPQPYIVTRYIPGPPLNEVIRERGPLAPADLHRLGVGLANALEAIHAVGVVHRDLKPGNVLIHDGDPVLIDFGIAHLADEIRLTSTGLVMGTPGYLSPEVIDGGQVTRATDWWGWAATLAFAATGRPPFGTGPVDVVLSRVGRGECDLSRVDPALEPLLAAALSPRPQDRPEAGEVLEALARYAQGRPVTGALRQPVRRAPRADDTQVIASGSTAVMPAVRLPEPATARAAGPAGAYAAPAPAGPRSGSRGGGPSDGYRPDGPPSRSDDPYLPDRSDPGVGATAYDPRTLDAAPGAVESRTGVDPRIGRPQRSGSLAGLLLSTTALMAVMPVAAGLLALLWSSVARAVDRSTTSLLLRRHTHGARRSDLPLAVVSSPWHLVMGILTAVAHAVLPLVVGASAAFFAALGLAAVVGGPARFDHVVAIGIGALVALLVAWWGPGGTSLRRGSRSLVRGLVPQGVAPALVAVCVVVALGAAWYAVQQGLRPDWAPLTQSPWNQVPGL